MGLNIKKWYPECDDYKYCSEDPKCPCYPPPSLPPPPPPFDEGGKNGSHEKHSNISTYLIIGFVLVATAFFILCGYAIYAKFFSGWRLRRRSLSRQRTQEGAFDFDDDEEHGPVVDHPIWYIRTTGLQQSVIGAITVCKYKRGEGLIEGTECSVCLSEFQEDENLRLLPKCNHAFHLPCIDTWLTSHTNCPLCRAPIVTHPAILPSADPNTSSENVQIQVLEHGGEGTGGVENSALQLRNGEGEEGEQVEEGRGVSETSQSLDSEVVSIQPRRSVSLDSSAAANINLALANVVSMESHGNSKRVGGNRSFSSAAKGGSSSFRTRYLHSEPTSMKRSRSFNGKHLLSWYSRSQRKPNAPLRSF